MKRITIFQEKEVQKLYARNFSASEISSRLDLSLNQIYDCLIRHGVPRRKPWQQNKIRFQKTPLSFNFKKKLSSWDSELLAAAVMLYLGEGAKTGTTVDFANSNVGSLKVFINFLRKVCKIDENRLRLYLYCFSNQDKNKLIRFWSKVLKVKKNCFTKPYIRTFKTESLRIMDYGVLHIRYSDKRLLEKILGLSDELTKKLSV